MTDDSEQEAHIVVPGLGQLGLHGISTNLDDAIPAISELFLNLKRILAARPPPDMDPVLAEQRRTIRVLRAFSDFVSRSCCNPALKNAIRRLLLDHALRMDDLSDGVRHLVLTEVTRPGRKPDPYDVWSARQCACAFLECLIQGRKCGREQAAKIVAADLPILQRIMRDATEARITENRKPGKKRAAQTALEHAILSWRLQFQQGEVPKIMQGAWEEILQYPTLPSCLKEWEERAELFKKLAQEKASAIILREGKIQAAA